MTRGLPASAADYASVAVAGATLVLAAMTGLLAMFTWRALASTQQEVRNTEAALAAAQEQVKATNRQAEIAERALLASWRPLMIEIPLHVQGHAVIIDPRLDKPFRFVIGFLNAGRGPALVTKALFGLGSAAVGSVDLQPRVVYPEGACEATFELDARGPDRSMVSALMDIGNTPLYSFSASIEYHDLGSSHAWRSTARVVRSGTTTAFELSDLEVSDR